MQPCGAFIRAKTPSYTEKGQVRPRISRDEYELIKRHREMAGHTDLAQYCEDNGIPLESVTQYWHKGEHFSVMSKTVSKAGERFGEVFQRILDKHNTRTVAPKLTDLPSSEKALKVTITDEHVGMDTLYDKAIFHYKYGKEEYQKSMDKVVSAILKEHAVHGRFDLLLIDSLGDQPDGWNGNTTRGGHELPQNMSNDEMFEVCVEARLKLIEQVLEANVADKVILRCVSDDNHAGSFALIVNKALKMLVNKIYDKDVVEVDILDRFMEHRVYGDHCFILTHGKDSTHMNRGLPLALNDKTKAFITDYIDHHDINSKYIHVEKGDLHQLGYERTKKFDYRNYGSFAPPSSWVQMNFGDIYSCFSVQVVPKYSSEISHTDYFLDYKKIPQSKEKCLQ